MTTQCVAQRTGKSQSAPNIPPAPFLDSGLRRNNDRGGTDFLADPYFDCYLVSRIVISHTTLFVIPAKAGIQWFRQDIPTWEQAGMTTLKC